MTGGHGGARGASETHAIEIATLLDERDGTPAASSCSVPHIIETTLRIGTDELDRLLEIAGQSTRVTAEIAAVDLDAILGAERGPVLSLTEQHPLIDLGEMVHPELMACEASESIPELVLIELPVEIYDSPRSWSDDARGSWSIRFTTSAPGA